MKAEKGHSRVLPLQPDGVARPSEVEPEAVSPWLVRPVTVRADHLGERRHGHDPSAEE